MMRRHLLTLFALFTGLAALQAPAHASAVQSVVQNAQSVAGSNERAASDTCACPQRAREQANRCPKPEPKKPWKWLPSWLRPSVLIGSDRALE